MHVPIIFVHRSNSIYLKYTLKQARFFNPDEKIYLLGDESNDCYDFIEHHSIKNYFGSAAEFGKHYIYQSFNTRQFEQFCFERWFIAKDFVAKHKIDQFICLDSDVLIFCNTAAVHHKFKIFSFTMRGNYGAGFNYFSSRSSITNFCDYIMNYYTQPELMHILHLYWEGFQKRGSGGVCDMVLFSFYKEEYPDKIGDCGIEENGIIFEYVVLDLMENNEQLNYKKGIPYILKKETGKWVKLKALHVNVEKDKIYRYYTGGGLYSARFKDWFRDMRDKYQLRTKIKNLLGS